MHRLIAVAVLTAVACVPLAGATAARKPGAKLIYVYEKPKAVAPGADVELDATCPKGTLAISAGFSAYDEKAESGSGAPGVSVVFSSVISDKPAKEFKPRIGAVGLRNEGTNPNIVASPRVVCVPDRETRLIVR